MGSTTNRNSGSNLDAVARLRASAPANAAEARSTVERELTRIETETAALAAAAAFAHETLAQKLVGWRDTVNLIGPFIVNLLASDAPLTTRLRTVYFAAIEAALTKGVAGSTRLQLLKRHNLALTWWARQHFETARRKVVFIIGPDNDDFYHAAKRYYEFQRDHVPAYSGLLVVHEELSLEQIMARLVSMTSADDLPWGEVNVVSHANTFGWMQLKARSDDDDGASIPSLTALGEDVHPLPPTVLDSASRFFIRGCAVGNSPEFLDRLRITIGREDPTADLEVPHLIAPKYLQVYEYNWSGNDANVTSANEYFKELWYVGYASKTTMANAALASLFHQRYPSVSVDWNRLLGLSANSKHKTLAFASPDEDTEAHEEWIFPGNAAAQTQIFLMDMLRAAQSPSDHVTNIRRSDRTRSDGRIEIVVTFDRPGHPNNVAGEGDDFSVLPTLGTQIAIHNFIPHESDIVAFIRPMENAVGLRPQDFFWEISKASIPHFSFKKRVRFRFFRTHSRVHRPLTNPIGSTRVADRVPPDVQNANHYTSLVPPLYQLPPA